MIKADAKLTVYLDKTSYNVNEYMQISGLGANSGSTITISIFDAEQNKITTLNITATGNGEFSTLWLIPPNLTESSDYELTIEDGRTNNSIKFTINNN